MRRFVIFIDQEILFGRSYEEGRGARGVWNVWRRVETVE
jgi:hypothetical protein